MDAVRVRPAEERDLDRAGDVNFLAFYDVALRHGQEPTVAAPAAARGYLRYLAGVDPLGGLVAEEGGEIVGVAWVHVRGPVTTIGPLAVHPQAQGRGVGRRLLARAVEAAGGGQVRLVHESFNALALGLYLKAGFRVVAPLVELVCPAGGVGDVAAAGVRLRPAEAEDRVELVARDARAFGAARPQSLEPYLRRGRVLVAEDGRGLVGYACGIGVRTTAYVGSAAADDGAVLCALLGALTAELAGAGAAVHVLVPAADRALLDGLAARGYRVFRACQYMVRGGGTAPPPNYVLMNGDMM
jgi:ribosomal protein S18 acetylase RimI-like enzyme